jgi:hypothetical protein
MGFVDAGVEAVEGTGLFIKESLVRQMRFTLGSPRTKLQVLGEELDIGVGVIKGGVAFTRDLHQGVTHPGAVVDAMQDLGNRKTGRIVGSSAFDAAGIAAGGESLVASVRATTLLESASQLATKARARLSALTRGGLDALAALEKKIPIKYSANPGANLGNLKFKASDISGKKALKSGVPSSDLVPNPDAGDYVRPRRAGPTAEQSRSVQGSPCVDCGEITPKQIADHKDPLSVQHFRDGKIDIEAQRSLDAVQPHCPTCSAQQGGQLSAFVRKMREVLGLKGE